MVYKSKKGIFAGAVLLGVFSILLVSTVTAVLESSSTTNKIFAGLVLLGYTVFTSWMWFYTDYRIKEDHIYYRCGPFAGKISVDSIKKIQNNTTMYVGFKPALGKKGLVISYNKYDDIYFSPKDAKRFVEEIQKLNPQIEVIG